MFHTFLIAMLPIVELRGAIPYGLSQGLDFWPVFWAAYFGNLIPIAPIILFIRRIFSFLRETKRFGTLIIKLEERAHLKGRLVRKYRAFGLFVLVAIPLPGTGAWTGALVSAVLDLRLKMAFPIIAMGVLVAGVLVALLSYSAIILM